MASRSTGYKKRTTKTSGKKGKSSVKNNGVQDDILLVLILALSVLLLFSTFGLLGKIGKSIGSILFGLFGMVAYLFPFFVAFELFFFALNKGKKIVRIKCGAALILFIMVCCIAHLTFGHNITLPSGEKLGYFYKVHEQTKLTGGVIGGSIVHILKKFLGMFGAVVIILALTIISGVMFTERSFFKSLKQGGANIAEDARRMKEYRSRQAEVYELEKEERNQRARQRSADREEARKRRLAEQDAKREAALIERRERAEAARALREENAQKSRDEARALYLKQQAEEQLRQKAERDKSEKLILESEESVTYTDNSDDYADNVSEDSYGYEMAGTNPEEYIAPASYSREPEIMSFGERDGNLRRRSDNRVVGVMASTKLFDMSDTNGDIREITGNFENAVFDFDERVLSIGHRINISEDNVPDNKEAYERDIYIDDEDDITDDYQDVTDVVKDFDYASSEPASVRAKDETYSSVFISREKAEMPADTPDKRIEDSYLKPDNDKPVASVKNTASSVRMPKPSKNKAKYKYPPVNLLNEVKRKNETDSKAELNETAQKLKDTFKTFGVNVTILGSLRGPSVTRYEIQPEVGVKVSKIVSLTDDIKLALAATDIRMEAPIPGKSAIGIEVPNKENAAVQYRELIESRTFKDSASKISFAVGKDLNGQVVVSDIAKMPHVLIAGATGSGKSVCINTLIMSILYKATPDEVRLIMIDPKVVELSVYNGIPHLLLPVVTDPKKASASLQWAVNEMMRRYQCFADLQVRDMAGYNKAISENPEYAGSEEHKRMPQIVIIVDELADLMMVAAKEVEESICRLAQLARAAGIHLVLATQRPSVDVITGLIKANMPSRIAFSVSSGTDSRTILDMVGAEKLLGKGDMLFYPQNFTKPARIQGAFVSDDEVKNVVDYLKAQVDGSPYDEKAQELVNRPSGQNASSGGGFSAPEQDNGYDALFYEAGKSIIEKQKASIGMLQRLHKIGFNRAARIMDQLSDAGVVGPEEGTKPRAVLMNLDEFEAFIQENNK